MVTRLQIFLGYQQLINAILFFYILKKIIKTFLNIWFWKTQCKRAWKITALKIEFGPGRGFIFIEKKFNLNSHMDIYKIQSMFQDGVTLSTENTIQSYLKQMNPQTTTTTSMNELDRMNSEMSAATRSMKTNLGGNSQKFRRQICKIFLNSTLLRGSYS